MLGCIKTAANWNSEATSPDFPGASIKKKETVAC